MPSLAIGTYHIKIFGSECDGNDHQRTLLPMLWAYQFTSRFAAHKKLDIVIRK